MSHKVCAQNSHEVPYFHRTLGKQDVLEPWILQSTYLRVLSSCLFSLFRQMYAVLITSEKSGYSMSCTLSIESAHSVCLWIDAVEGPMLWQSKMSSLHPKSKSRSVLRRSGKNSAAKLWRLRPKGQIQQPLRSRKRPTIKHGMKHNETVDILSKKITDFMQNILKQDDGSIMWITMKQVSFLIQNHNQSDSKSMRFYLFLCNTSQGAGIPALMKPTKKSNTTLINGMHGKK